MPIYHLLSLLSVWSFFLWYASLKQSQMRKELQEIVFQLMGKDQRKSLFVLRDVNLCLKGTDKQPPQGYDLLRYIFYLAV